MSRYLKLSMAALTVFLAFAIFAPVASARPVVVVRGYYGPGFYGRAWYGPAAISASRVNCHRILSCSIGSP